MLFMSTISGQCIEKYGPVMHSTLTFHNFESIKNTVVPSSVHSSNASTVIINGYPKTPYATFILDIGDKNGNKNGKNPFRIMKIYLDRTGAQTSYEAIPITDIYGQIIPGRLGRVDGNGTSVFGPNGKIYFISYSPSYLIEFDPTADPKLNRKTAVAYPFELPSRTSGSSTIKAEAFYISAGPPSSGGNSSTLIYGSTFNFSLVWWFDPANPAEGIQYITMPGPNNTQVCTDQDIDNRQNYIEKVIGRGQWIYVVMNRMDYDRVKDGAFKSVYAINTKTQKKFLLFHSTAKNFDIKAYKQLNSQNVYEYNIYLELDHGMAPGTIYKNPLGIDINQLPPATAGTNCPCYNISPDVPSVTNLHSLPSSVRNLINNPPFSQSDYTGYVPENTKFRYDENYAWPRVNNYTVIDPPMSDFLPICDPAIDNGPYINVPWDIVGQVPGVTIPNRTNRICFEITGKFVNTANPINATNAFQIPWDSYDPNIGASDKPKTAWDEEANKLYFKYDLLPRMEIELQKFSETNSHNDLYDYYADLAGLSMTTSTAEGLEFGAPTLVKGAMKEELHRFSQ